jgi:hypothetical protein
VNTIMVTVYRKTGMVIMANIFKALCLLIFGNVFIKPYEHIAAAPSTDCMEQVLKSSLHLDRLMIVSAHPIETKNMKLTKIASKSNAVNSGDL